MNHTVPWWIKGWTNLSKGCEAPEQSDVCRGQPNPYLLWYRVCVCYWPPVHEVCPNYKVVRLQPRTLITLDLFYAAYCYIAYLLNLPHPLFLTSNVRLGEEANYYPAAPAINARPVAARNHPPTRVSPVSVPAYQKTFARLSLTLHFQGPTSPPLPHPHTPS